MKFKGLIACIVAGWLGLIIAVALVPGVKVEGDFSQSVKILLLAGVVLGLINFFVKPIIDLITLPIRWLTFGLFSLVINMGMVWGIDLLFSEIKISSLKALFLTGLLVCLLNFFVPRLSREKKN